MQALADTIDAALRAAGTPERAVQERRYLKSDLRHYGTSVPATRGVVKQALAKLDLGHDDLVELVKALWARQVHECRMAAVEALDLSANLLEPGDIELLERLLRESRTWALVDGLAASVVGPLVEREPGVAAVLERWAHDPDLWIRRSALLAELVALRRGEGNFERFARHADLMLEEKEFFVRKAIGWVLRDTARKRPQLVYEWLLPRAARASGVTVREAVKRLPEPQAGEILALQRGE